VRESNEGLVAPPTSDAAPSVESDAAVASEADEYTAAAAWCGQPRESVYLATSGEELLALIVGDWFSCTPGALGAAEVGIRFLPEERYELLFEADGGIETGLDAATRGTWQLGDNGTGSGGDPAILIQSDAEPGGGWWVLTPNFSNDPLRFRIEFIAEEIEFVSRSAVQ
jgi:hypothetical protein